MADDTRNYDVPPSGQPVDPQASQPKRRNTYQASGMLTPSELASLKAALIEAGASAQRELAKLDEQRRSTMLTPSERESLRQWASEAIDLAQKEYEKLDEQRRAEMLSPEELASLKQWAIEAGAQAQAEFAKLAKQDPAAGNSDNTDDNA